VKREDMAKKLTYYEILEVFPAATQEEIDSAFKNMLFKYHPDHNPDKPDWAHEKTSEVVYAYKILSEPLRRTVYNFMIFATLRERPAEIKFNIFQGADKKKYEEACAIFAEGVSIYDAQKAEALLKFQHAFAAYKLPEAVYNMGVFYTATNKLSEAMRAFREASKLDPENQHYIRTIDKLTELTRELDKAKKMAGTGE
jgi:DnaJ-class molecular chaperone